MGIEITSGGVSKTFRYYPYDAFYVDANGNLNTSGNGEQVMEAYFNGVKYYPDANCGVWGIRLTVKCKPYISYRGPYGYVTQDIGTLRLSYAFLATFDSTKYSIEEFVTDAPTTLMSFTPNDDDIRLSSLRFIARIKANFDETVTRANPNYNISFNRNRLTQGGQAIFDELAAGTVYELPLFNGYQSYGTSDGALAQATDLPVMGQHNKKIFLFSCWGVGFNDRYYLGVPIVRLDLDYNPNAVPSQNWQTDPDGNQYPFIFLLGPKDTPRAAIDNDFARCDNRYVYATESSQDTVQYWESFNPADGQLSVNDLLPLPS